MSSRRSPERRQVDLDGVEPEQKVLAEAAAAHLGVEVGVGRREDTHVDAAGARGADPFQLARLQHPQELGLLAGLQRTDLIE